MDTEEVMEAMEVDMVDMVMVIMDVPFKNNLLIVPRTFETQIVKSCGKNEVPFLQQG